MVLKKWNSIHTHTHTHICHWSVAKYICRILFLTTSNFPIHNTFYVSDVHISTKSVAHYKKQTPSSGSTRGSEFGAFCAKRNSGISLNGRYAVLYYFTPYLAVNFNSARHLHFFLTTHFPQSNFDIHSQHVLLHNTLNIYRFWTSCTIVDKHTWFQELR
jgi:hypothetical protein